jgi:hypothetical protein
VRDGFFLGISAVSLSIIGIIRIRSIDRFALRWSGSGGREPCTICAGSDIFTTSMFHNKRWFSVDILELYRCLLSQKKPYRHVG